MQFASFDLADPVFECFGRRFSFQLVTLENLYGLDPAEIQLHTSGDEWRLVASGLRWAGGQQCAPGRFEAHVQRVGQERLRLRMHASAPAEIRCLKWLVRDLDPELAVLRSDGSETEVGRFGQLLEYPTRLPLPLVRLRAGREALALRAEDPRVRPKRCALSVERVGALAGRGVVEWIHEEDATRFAATLESPDLWLATAPPRRRPRPSSSPSQKPRSGSSPSSDDVTCRPGRGGSGSSRRSTACTSRGASS